MSIEIYRDAWGVPHLRAADPEELAFAQGRVTARDRAWQLEVERHRAQGTTASFLGAAELGWDAFARRSRLADTARRCFDRLAETDATTASWVRAYVDGVNDGLAEGAVRAPEFASTGLAPGRWEPWTPLAVWLSTHVLFAGFPTKLWRDEVARRLGEEWTELFATDGPGTAGSNGWVVAGERTASGAALVAGDPHRFIEAPGVYQQIRLACPAYDVVGLAVPGVPGLAHFGHTGPVAWAITNAMADYQDLYRERLRRRPDGAVEALGPDGWAPAAAHRETVEVAGAEPVVTEVIETARGPVIIGGPPEDGSAEWEGIALRHPPRVTGELGFRALPALLRARTVADVDAALDGWVEPVNVVQAADTRGGLLHRVAGHVPVRDRANSLRVVPAWDPAHSWADAPAPLPRAEVHGHAVMANARGLAAPLGVEFAPSHRAARIDELLAASTAWTPETTTTIHRDTANPSATALLTAVRRVGGDGGLAAGEGASTTTGAAVAGADAVEAVDAVGAVDVVEAVGGTPAPLSPAGSAVRARLLDWDRRMDPESVGAGLYAAVRGAVVRRLARHEAFAALREPAPYPELFQPWLALGPRVAFALETLLVAGPVPAGDVDRIVREALDEVGAGEPPAAWGVTHRLAPWQALPDPDDGQWPGLGGDHDCVLSTSSVPGWTDRSARASAARYVWDLDDRQRSRWIVPFGASGVPGDPHHRDQLPLWLRGELAPVTTDWQKLEKEQGMTVPVHVQTVEGFGTVTVRPVDPDADAHLLHGWVNEERARFWGMVGTTVEQVREIYAHLDSLTTHHGYLVSRDGEPVALFQTYDPAADRVSECYEALPGDIGVHLFVAPGLAPEPGFTGRLLTALVDFSLTDHTRIVIEPDAANEKALARMTRAGFELGPEVVLPEVDLPEVFIPEKRARLAFLSR
ncbi:GNAT family N-acetyltransferase [Streptomyces sp. NPDC008122]|uniref:GNAT family N-acetyltransferase n=1 Tax=Streptomyces sp. NPDC008122 TaxID=3364810 RepID=UPI0036EC7344